MGTKATILARSTNPLLFVLRHKLRAFKTNGLVSGLAARLSLIIKVTPHFPRNFLESIFCARWFVYGLEPIRDLSAKYDNISPTVTP